MDIAVSEVSEGHLRAYARLFQFEHWLREMTYVELKARFANEWTACIDSWQRHFKADKELTHMPTTAESPLSYITFSQLRTVIAIGDRPRFSRYNGSSSWLLSGASFFGRPDFPGHVRRPTIDAVCRWNREPPKTNPPFVASRSATSAQCET